MSGDIGTLTTDSLLKISNEDLDACTAIKVDAVDTIATSRWSTISNYYTATEIRQRYLDSIVEAGEKCIQDSLQYPLLEEEREFLEASLKLIKIKEKLNKLNTWVTK